MSFFFSRRITRDGVAPGTSIIGGETTTDVDICFSFASRARIKRARAVYRYIIRRSDLRIARRASHRYSLDENVDTRLKFIADDPNSRVTSRTSSFANSHYTVSLSKQRRRARRCGSTTRARARTNVLLVPLSASHIYTLIWPNNFLSLTGY